MNSLEALRARDALRYSSSLSSFLDFRSLFPPGFVLVGVFPVLLGVVPVLLGVVPVLLGVVPVFDATGLSDVAGIYVSVLG